MNVDVLRSLSSQALPKSNKVTIYAKLSMNETKLTLTTEFRLLPIVQKFQVKLLFFFGTIDSIEFLRSNCAIAFSAKNPCNLGPLSSFAVSLLREASKKTVLAQSNFLGGSGSDSRKELVGVSLEDVIFCSTRISVNSSSSRFDNMSSCAHSMFSSLFVFLIFAGSPIRYPNSRLLVHTHRVIAGPNVVEFTSSCPNDVATVLVVELDEPVDDPGTAIGK